ncbi:hypothetical protein [uncultured Tenacibaculum sp.]|uniref:hypothetical protein n=1 Tax=uncultured Tenacibaculum sp. TaxID=174713 RepID=UPI00263010C9|nr:hypothetical protein [uncultured Tenacibaculum sp.]
MKIKNQYVIQKCAVVLLFALSPLFFCCQNVKPKEQHVFKQELNRVVEKYIEDTPMDVGPSFLSHPSYHMYLRKKDKDTVLTLIQFPHVNSFDIDLENESEKGATFREIKPNGWCLYKNKYPIVVFDKIDFKNKFIDKEELIKIIPDSLKLKEQARCYVRNPNMTNYILANGFFCRKF